MPALSWARDCLYDPIAVSVPLPVTAGSMGPPDGQGQEGPHLQPAAAPESWVGDRKTELHISVSMMIHCQTVFCPHRALVSITHMSLQRDYRLC